MPQGRRRHKKESRGFKPWQQIDRCGRCGEVMPTGVCLLCGPVPVDETQPVVVRRRPALTPISTDRLGPILVSDVADAPIRRVQADWGSAMQRSFGARSRQYKAAPSGAFGGEAKRMGRAARETSDEATRRGYAYERISFEAWRDREEESDIDVEYCPDCATELRFTTNLSGTVGWECVQCRAHAFARAFDGVSVILRGRQSTNPFTCRRRHFEAAAGGSVSVKQAVPWWQGGPRGGFDAQWIPRGYEAAGNLTLSLLKHLSTVVSSHTLPQDEDAAQAMVVWLRWPNGARCMHCASADVYMMKSARRLWKCRDCGKQFTAKVNTIFHDSPVPLRKWLFALWMLATQRYGVSSYMVSEAIGISQKSAWMLLDRIRRSLSPADQSVPSSPS